MNTNLNAFFNCFILAQQQITGFHDFSKMHFMAEQLLRPVVANSSPKL